MTVLLQSMKAYLGRTLPTPPLVAGSFFGFSMQQEMRRSAISLVLFEKIFSSWNPETLGFCVAYTLDGMKCF